MKMLDKLVKIALFSILSSSPVFAADIFDVVNKVAGQVTSVETMIKTLAYVVGLGMLLADLFKFKQHKDNPTQVPIGTPAMIMGIGAAMVFLVPLTTPSVETLFADAGSEAQFTQGGGKDPGTAGGDQAKTAGGDQAKTAGGDQPKLQVVIKPKLQVQLKVQLRLVLKLLLPLGLKALVVNSMI